MSFRKIIFADPDVIYRHLFNHADKLGLTVEQTEDKLKQLHNVDLVRMSDLNLKKTIEHLQQKEKFDLISNETGITTAEPVLTNPNVNENPIDTL